MSLISRNILPLIVVPLVALLMFKGTVTPVCEAEVSAAFTEVLGTIVLLGTMAITALHNKGMKRIEATTPENEEEVRISRLNALAAVVKSMLHNFIYTKPKSVSEPPKDI